MTTESVTPIEASEARLGRGDRLQPVVLLAAIGAGLALGRLAPGVADPASRAVSAGVFVLITLVMLNINPRNASKVITRRRFLGAAIVLNFVVNPILAWALGRAFLSGDPDLRVGLLLFLVTPCIGWYLVFTELAGGDAELGVGLLSINVVLQIGLLPIYLAVFVDESASVDTWTMVRSIVLYLVLPAVSAGGIRAWWSHQGRCAAVEQRRLGVPALKTAALSFVLVAMFASQAEVLFDEMAAVRRLIVPMVAFFTLTFLVATTVGKHVRLPYPQTVLLVFTTTSRNSEASLAIAATAFASPLVALTVALGPVIELPLLIIMTRCLSRGSATPDPEPVD